MKNFSLKIICLLLQAAFAKALNCYHCAASVQLSPDEFPIPASTSCEAGSIPMNNLIKNCEDLVYNYVSDGNGRYIGLPNDVEFKFPDSNNSSEEISITEQLNLTYSCYKLTAEGKRLSWPETNDKVIIRSCIVSFSKSHPLSDVCYSDTNTKIGGFIKEEEIKTLIPIFSQYFRSEAEFGVCSCNSDECNSGMRSMSFGVPTLFVVLYVHIFNL